MIGRMRDISSRSDTGCNGAGGADLSAIKLLMLTTAIMPDRIGGLERYVRELSDALARAGTDVMIVTRRLSTEDPELERTDDGVIIARYRTPEKSNRAYALGYPAAALKATAAAIRRMGRERIVHTHFPLHGLGAVACHAPFIHTFHAPVHREVLAEHQRSYPLPTAMRGLMRESVRVVEQVVVRRPRTLITLSRFMANEAVALGAAPQDMVRIPGGIDTARFCPGEPIGGERAWRGSGPLLFTARRFVPRTGVLELVRAMPEVCRAVPGARLAIAGRGPLEPRIREAIAALGLQRDIRLLGWVSEDDLVRWLRTADLVVIPTQELEGFGLATAEALGCGTPVVGTPAGATAELLEQLDSSLLTRDATPAAIASTLTEHLLCRERLRELASRARAVVHPSMAWAHVANEHLALYAQLGHNNRGQLSSLREC